MKIILCPTDFSSNASNSLAYGISVAEKFNAKILLMHVFENPVIYSDQAMVAVQFADEQIRKDANAKLSALHLELQKKYPALQFETTLQQGEASDNIIRIADLYEVDMIILGTTGTTKVERLLMGSTTAKVIQHAECPVLCIPPDAKFHELKKIVFATDLEKDNLDAAVGLASFARIFNSEIIFLFVDDKHLIHSDEYILHMTDKIRSHIRYPKISGFICKNNNITEGIEFFLTQQNADMLCMYSHKKKFPENIFSRSFTKVMANETHLPLLVFRESTKMVAHL